MGKIFDETGKVKNREDLLSIGFGARPGLRKVTDESTERARILRVEDASGSRLDITPKTVDFDLVERISD